MTASRLPLCLSSLNTFQNMLICCHYQRRKILIVCICNASEPDDNELDINFGYRESAKWLCGNVINMFQSTWHSHTAYIFMAHCLVSGRLQVLKSLLQLQAALPQRWSEKSPTVCWSQVRVGSLSLHPELSPLTSYWSLTLYHELLITLRFESPEAP